MILHQKKDDEDKGSPSQDGANLRGGFDTGFRPAQPSGRKNRMFSGSPSGVPITRFIFPSENQFCNNTA